MSTKKSHPILEKWNSCPFELRIPNVAVSKIRKLHVYDFDNTLFNSPGPNNTLYTKEMYNIIMSATHLYGGGWWNNPDILEQCAVLIEHYEKTDACQFWNPDIVKLAALSFQAEDTISIILTGRKEQLFHEVIESLLKVSRDVRGLGESPNDFKFNAVCLKKYADPANTAPISELTTMSYKSELITDFIESYKELEEVTIYDDRPNQLAGFKKLSTSFTNSHIQWFIVPVPKKLLYLPQDVENVIAKEMISRHQKNMNPNFSVTWTSTVHGYILQRRSFQRLLRWSFSVLKIPRGETALTEPPLYIPAVLPDEHLSTTEIVKVWRGGSTKSDGSMETDLTDDDILRKFYHPIKEDDVCLIPFLVTFIGYGRVQGKYEIYYKVNPIDNSNYIYNEFSQLVIIGSNSKHNNTRSVLSDKSITWVKVKSRVKIYTYFGSFNKMKLLKEN